MIYVWLDESSVWNWQINLGVIGLHPADMLLKPVYEFCMYRSIALMYMFKRYSFHHIIIDQPHIVTRALPWKNEVIS
jgi:hypothetical protein